MSNPRYPEEFKIQAVNQVTEKKLSARQGTQRLKKMCREMAVIEGIAVHGSETDTMGRYELM
jgi:transposase-like protein